MRILMLAALFPVVLNVGLCGSSQPEPEAQEPASAAERLQKGRNMYEGNVPENLRTLQDDLNLAGGERLEQQQRAIEAATQPE